jgi:lauroyl/myristoyl acyltransferase
MEGVVGGKMSSIVGYVETCWRGGDGEMVLSVSPPRTMYPLRQQKVLADIVWSIFEYEIKGDGEGWFYNQNKWE